ncbi:uncharacterized protein LOC119992414 isoform X2 [Tripterygium wilfordii]|uniref:uncharacterized protein LOC119992414 isoform X2 n=1 Tax=Tripterygium wilfordii TaxID=458696 RepID=UPI0018F81611|nr:uncharacterized protein LOC119992414 isoform X2 [Tripterygium wilfordii]
MRRELAIEVIFGTPRETDLYTTLGPLADAVGAEPDQGKLGSAGPFCRVRKEHRRWKNENAHREAGHLLIHGCSPHLTAKCLQGTGFKYHPDLIIGKV